MAYLQEDPHEPWSARIGLLILDEARDHAAVASSCGHHIHSHDAAKGGEVVPVQHNN
jgi:hypothetical protein